MEDDVAGGDYDPFWKGFPYCDIHDAIMPDVLHQLYQGVIKHLISWIQSLMTKDEFDSRLRSLPPAFGILIACLVGKIDSRGIIAARSLLDFIHLVQYPSHDGRTLRYAEEALDSWHANRAYFKEKEVRDHFNIPKFHSLLHYIPSIKLKGTTDNGNTEAFEHLHITFAKDGWRASNKRDAFPQMITWLSRQEKRAPEPNKTLEKISCDHNAPMFVDALKRFINGLRKEPLPRKKLLTTPLPFARLDCSSIM
ncbi:hypothetical protein BT96DRAFT_959768 [Gymnopus androsaceus JB14]|uniref:Uncharacterized protein n=1 Tax=Gymnopus androsaceus JB14 TaxID=1447944 RepID=A0A6A4GXL5_9AGAR|nr:hypothetical protein BT96DRAFT_959768 [Gymnopus androsaceus JB14]